MAKVAVCLSRCYLKSWASLSSNAFFSLHYEREAILKHKALHAGQLNEVELENQKLKATLEDSQQRHQQAVSQAEALTSSLAQYQSTLSGYTSQVEELQSELRTVQQQVIDSKQEAAAKEDQLQALTAEHSRLSRSLQETEVQFPSLSLTAGQRPFVMSSCCPALPCSSHSTRRQAIWRIEVQCVWIYDLLSAGFLGELRS